jgi:NMD protein affecting ribosome stability and mRNA decay
VNDPTKMPRRSPHRHRAITTHVVIQRAGVPYELERRVCETCGRELEVRPLRRAAA